MSFLARPPRRARSGRIAGAVAILVATVVGLSAPTVAATAARSVTARRSVPRAGAPRAGSCLPTATFARWGPARRAAQLVALNANEADVGAVRAAVAAGAGGIVLFGSSAPADLATRLAHLEAAAGAVRPFVMTDEEGGEVQRMANLVGAIPWARTMAATMTPAAVERLATRVARRMRAAGVSVDLAPDLDLASGPGPDARHTDGPRSFSPVPSRATTYGLAFARGLEAGGILPVVKHFPGEGHATANTDLAPAATPPLSVLERADLLPFEAAVRAGMPAVMVGNASVPGLTTLPASLSPAVVGGLLRRRLGFHGLVVTDALNAVAVERAGYPLNRAVVAAISAGVDLALFKAPRPVAAFESAVAALLAAERSGRLSPATVAADDAVVLAAKGRPLCPSAGPSR